MSKGGREQGRKEGREGGGREGGREGEGGREEGREGGREGGRGRIILSMYENQEMCRGVSKPVCLCLLFCSISILCIESIECVAHCRMHKVTEYTCT